VLDQEGLNASFQKNQKNDYDIDDTDVLKMPTNIGVTGFAFQNKTITYANSITRAEVCYNSDIDNMVNAGHVRNFLMGVVFNSNNEVNGLI
jgi:hypothetical protein